MYVAYDNTYIISYTSRHFEIDVDRVKSFLLATILTYIYRFFNRHVCFHIRIFVKAIFDLTFLQAILKLVVVISLQSALPNLCVHSRFINLFHKYSFIRIISISKPLKHPFHYLCAYIFFHPAKRFLITLFRNLSAKVTLVILLIAIISMN